MFEFIAKKNSVTFLIAYCDEMEVNQEMKSGELVITLRAKLPTNVTTASCGTDTVVARVSRDY